VFPTLILDKEINGSIGEELQLDVFRTEFKCDIKGLNTLFDCKSKFENKFEDE
jgi:hypothetical protein